MSDNDSIDPSPRRNSRLNNAPSRRFPTDFPLNTIANSTEVVAEHISALLRSARRAIYSQQHFGYGRGGGVWGTDTPQSPLFSEEEQVGIPVRQRVTDEEALQQAMSRSTIDGKPQKEKQLKPITTLVSALPKTTYKEQDETKGSERSLSYVRVQRMLLKYLDAHASDTLTSLQARRWTQAIEPSTKKPKANEALRLCYYMRSQGFDTYANLNNGSISLFVANQRFYVRDRKHDHLYWKQCIKTNFISYIAPSPSGGVMRAANARRNATFGFALQPTHPTQHTNQGLEDFVSQLVSGQAPAAEARENEEQAGEEDGDAAPRAAGPDQQQVPRQPVTLSVLAAHAEAELNRLLNSNNQDPTAIEAAMMQVEELNQQIHQA